MSILKFDNAFQMLDTHGLPLAVCMLECHKQGVPVNLTQFKLDALRAGWKPEKIEGQIHDALSILRRKHCTFYEQETI